MVWSFMACTSNNITPLTTSRRMKWMGHVTCVGERRSAHRNLLGKPEGKIPLEGPRRILEILLVCILREVGWERVDWMDLAQDRNK